MTTTSTYSRRPLSSIFVFWRSGAPLVNRATKKFLARLVDPAPLSQEEIDEGYALCDSEDYAEGLRAFLAKEKPSFEGL